MPTRSHFDHELELMNIDLIKMGSMIEEAIAKSIKALEAGSKNLALEVIEDDSKVDDLEKAIERRCMRLLLRQQPVAKDLRAISTALKMITDIERIGDQAADIADLSLRFQNGLDVRVAEHIPQMARIAVEMVRDSIESFVKNDLDLARATMKRDDDADDLFNIVKNELIESIITSKENADEIIDCMMIAKYLERIGDHAVNICEWVVFYSTGLHKKTQIL
ncbi:phosphate signaling complex protein PhoU [Candidatus Soleaferrea massiliensis]|uniref:phosphate signaling complex protein PhoU n=1 Tax=Candidatus Soleaferrea massiliensis TaxID=1470354 RepID=UPI00059040ED|nr:phosphate signaling complex protein PhoU [Candidatus Soleaferrea massiliensis]